MEATKADSWNCDLCEVSNKNREDFTKHMAERRLSWSKQNIFGEEETDGVLLIDATNAFNTLNRNALLHNIRYLCPSLSTYVRNVYGCPARLFVSGGQEKYH